jgi:hypothetical protein
MAKFLVVFESEYNNKESFKTDKIGDTIKKIVEDYELTPDYDAEIDYDKYNSDDPYDVGTFGKGFYDISFSTPDGDYAGRIMIFDLQD